MTNELTKAQIEEIEQVFEDNCYSVTIEDAQVYDALELSNIRAARPSWNEPGEITEDTDELYIVEGVQPMKGDTRFDLVAVVKFGKVAVIHG